MSYEPDMVSAMIKMTLVLVVVVGGLLGVLFYIRKKLKVPGVVVGSRLIKVLATHYLGVKKCISLVEVPGAVLVLGITNDRIQLLDKIEDPEILERLTGSNEEPGEPGSFADHLRKWTGRAPRGGRPSKD